MSEEILPAPEERVIHTLSPEERRKDALEHRPGFRTRLLSEVGPGTKAFEIAKRVLIGAYNDGFIHAGNLAYMAILAIFPFFILGAAVFSIVGEEGERAATINAVLYALPPLVGNVIEPVARRTDARSTSRTPRRQTRPMGRSVASRLTSRRRCRGTNSASASSRAPAASSRRTASSKRARPRRRCWP